MIRITEMARQSGASVDELRYIERKGFIKSLLTRLKQREVRHYQEADLSKLKLIIKYRRQGYTWDTAHKKALQELEKPLLL